MESDALFNRRLQSAQKLLLESKIVVSFFGVESLLRRHGVLVRPVVFMSSTSRCVLMFISLLLLLFPIALVSVLLIGADWRLFVFMPLMSSIIYVAAMTFYFERLKKAYHLPKWENLSES